MKNEIFRVVAAASEAVGGSIDKTDTTGVGVEQVIKTVIQVAMWGVGIISVGFIIWGGAKYIMSRGEPSEIKAAKDTIQWAVVGLILAILAWAIVEFVIRGARGGPGGEGESAWMMDKKNDSCTIAIKERKK